MVARADQYLRGADLGSDERSLWDEHVPTRGSVEIPPDPRVMQALGRNHSLETALADLVDNSIDASASEILIRFLRSDGRLRALYVVDNGRGMGPEDIDAAMTVGGRRDYAEGDLGRFGMGLKAASFSQARSVTVISQATGMPPVGRRWSPNTASQDFRCEKVVDEFCVRESQRRWSIPHGGSGTIVRWDEVNGFPSTSDGPRVEGFLTNAITNISAHLGLVFHRILECGAVQLCIDVEDTDLREAGLRHRVNPVDPFAYARSGAAGYPKSLTGSAAGRRLRFECHIWPPRSYLPQFRIGGHAASQWQGFYFYRNDRLLDAGGDWHGLCTMDPVLQLARVAVDIDDDVVGLFQMNAEKSRVLTSSEFALLAEGARADDGTTFPEYLEQAGDAYRRSRRRVRARKSMLPPGKGFAPTLRKAIESEIPLLEREEGISIRWGRLRDGLFFEVDRDSRILWLNQRFRPDRRAQRYSVNDAPLLKALLYLLAGNLFEGEYLGPKDRDNIDLWQAVLTAAAEDDAQWAGQATDI